MVVLGQGGFYLGNLVVFWQKWVYSAKSGFIRAKVVAWGKVVKFGQNLLYSDKNGCIWVRRMYLGQYVVFGQQWLYSDKVVVLGQK